MTKLTDSVQSPAEAEFTPTVFIDLTKTDTSQLQGVTVGDTVTVTITGTVKSVSMRENDGAQMGNLSVESKSVDIKGGKRNPFDELADDGD